MDLLLSERDEGARGLAGIELASQMSQSLVEIHELVEAAAEIGPLLLDRRTQLARDLVAPTFRTQARQLRGLVERKIELAETDQQP